MAQQIQSSMIEIPVNGSTVPAHLARPSGEGRWPGVVVIQEWWGLNDDIKRIARIFAEAGYAALSPDLYHGNESEEMEEARKFAMAMQWRPAPRKSRRSARSPRPSPRG